MSSLAHRKSQGFFLRNEHLTKQFLSISQYAIKKSKNGNNYVSFRFPGIMSIVYLRPNGQAVVFPQFRRAF